MASLSLNNNSSRFRILVLVTDTTVSLQFQDHNLKPRTLNRNIDERINKTLTRIAKIFKQNKTQIALHDSKGQIQTDDNITILQGFTQATSLHVLYNQQKEMSYYILINPPRIEHLRFKTSLPPTVGWPIIPEIQVHNVDALIWNWKINDITVDNTLVGYFQPKKIHIDNNTSSNSHLTLTCVPCNNNTQGEEVTLDLGNIRTNPCENIHIPSIERAKHYTTAPTSLASTRIMTYNVLADHCCTRSFKSQDGALSHITNQEHWNIDHRKQILLQEIISTKPDLLLLQECSKTLYHSFLVPHLKLYEMEGILDLKTTGQDGCALFYKKKRFELIATHCITSKDSAKARLDPSMFATNINEMQKMNTIFQIVVLKERKTLKTMICSNSHFYYHPRGEHLRLLQSHLLLMETDNILKQQDVDCAVFIGGDYNATPETASIEYLRNGKIEKCTMDRLFVAGITTEGISTSEQKNTESNESSSEMKLMESTTTTTTTTPTTTTTTRRHGNFVLEWEPIDWMDNTDSSNISSFTTSMSGFQHPFQFHSNMDEYLIKGTCNQPVTTLTPAFDGSLDWIFIDHRRLMFNQVWKLFDINVLEKYGALPNIVFPSDHVAVVCDVSFR